MFDQRQKELDKVRDSLASFAATGAAIGSLGRSAIHEEQKHNETKNENSLKSRFIRVFAPAGWGVIAAFPVNAAVDPLKNSPLASPDHLTEIYGLTPKNAEKFVSDFKFSAKGTLISASYLTSGLQEIGNLIHNPTIKAPEDKRPISAADKQSDKPSLDA